MYFSTACNSLLAPSSLEKIVVEGDPLPEGTVVTILAREAHETFEVPPELEAELLESIAEADRGETVSVDELLSRQRRKA